jgi:hypothetical protein
MLLTYGFSADIPNKLSIFYNQAYEALFQRHDALKGAYKRIRETILDIKEFSEIFSIFCIQTYDERKFQFSKSEAISYIEKAKEISNLEFNSENYLTDLLQSVCLLMEDGLFLRFSHRSFQEYFAALFIVNSNQDLKKRLLKKYQVYTGEDNIYKLVHELDRDFLEYEVILPFIISFFEKVNMMHKVNRTNYFNFLKLMWLKFEFRDGVLSGTVNNSAKYNSMVRFIINNIPNEKILNFSFNNPKSVWITEMLDKTKDSNNKFVYEINKLKVRDPEVKEFYSSGGYFSKRSLEILLNTRNSLQTKRLHTDEKLETILFKK